MRGWIRCGVLAAATIMACKFSPTAATGDAGVDGAKADGGVCQSLTAQCADDNTLRTCTVIGSAATDTPCAWGCLGSVGRCGQLAPTGGGATVTDLVDDTRLGNITIAGDINGDNGEIKGGTRAVNAAQYAGGVEYRVVNGIAVFRAKSWTIPNGMTIKLGGSRPIVLVAITTISVDDTLDVQGPCSTNKSGPGGFPGGMTSGASALGSGGGTGGLSSQAVGGGGGGYGGVGGAGGGGALGGAAFGDAEITILVGGGGGGAGGANSTGIGGGGGGAVQLVAGVSITLNSSAEIIAAGCGGTKGDNSNSGGGGGAGGAIVLEAHDISIGGALTVNGGGGGTGGNSGNDGHNGDVGRTRAAGGASGTAPGGSGGAGSGFDGLAGGTAANSGGGGGAVGRIRINTRTGSATVDNNLLSPNLLESDPLLGPSTQGSAHVQ